MINAKIYACLIFFLKGVIQCDDLAILSQWLKFITDNVVGLTNLQVYTHTYI
jgi:hypothetical protein